MGVLRKYSDIPFLSVASMHPCGDVHSPFIMQITSTYSTETIQLAFLSSDYETPVYLIYGSYGYSSPVIINSFTNAPPSDSWFYLPSECNTAKSKGKVRKAKENNPFKNRGSFGLKYF